MDGFLGRARDKVSLSSLLLGRRALQSLLAEFAPAKSAVACPRLGRYDQFPHAQMAGMPGDDRRNSGRSGNHGLTRP